MKVLTIGDLHIQIKNFKIIDLFLEKVLDIIKTDKYDFIVLLGDILHNHERLDTNELNKATYILKELSLVIKTYVLVGNHDMITNQEFCSINNWMQSISIFSNDNLIIVNDLKCEIIEGNKIIFAPYVYAGNFTKMLDKIEWKDSDLIFAHQELSGVKMGHIISTCEQWNEEYPLVISGHIHNKQKPQENMFYTGTPFTHSFGESENNSISEIIIQYKSKIIINDIFLNLPKKVNVYKSVEEMGKYKIPILKENDLLKITIKDIEANIKSFQLSPIFKNLSKDKQIKIVFKIKFKQITHEVNYDIIDFMGLLNERIEKLSLSSQKLFQDIL